MTSRDTTPVFPGPRSWPLDPPPESLRLLAEEPVSRVTSPTGRKAWLVTRYEDARAVLQSSDFSADSRKPGYPVMDNSHAVFIEGMLPNMDRPEHDVYRRMLAPAFMVKRMDSMRPAIQRIIDDLIDKMLEHGPPLDFVKEFAFPLPARVICELLGAPHEDMPFFVDCTEKFFGGSSSPDEVRHIEIKLQAYLDELLDAKARVPGEDLTSYMVVEYLEKGAIERHILLRLIEVLLIAGSDTTLNALALGLLSLLQYPDQLEALRSDSSLIPGAVDELLRYATVTHRGRPRVAISDVVVGGQLIRSGEGVIVAINAANRDPSIYENPNTVDIRRSARTHVAFGWGIHQCLGAALARTELQLAYETVLRRIPTIKSIVPVEELQYKESSQVYGVKALPISW
jgi:cytochrome P450